MKEAQHEVEKQKIRKQHTVELNAVQTKYIELSKSLSDHTLITDSSRKVAKS